MRQLSVLFVDDEPAILDGLRNQLRKERKRWEMRFVKSGKEALLELQREPADIVISDMRMPGMDGAELLGHIQRDFPRMARVILSGHAEHEAIMRALSVSHQYLHKPCDIEALRSVIERTHALNAVLHTPALASMVGKIEHLPSVPGIYGNLVRLSDDPHSSAQSFAQVVETDPAVSVKVLQLVNSAYFGLSHKVVSVRDAVTYLGTEIIKGLVLSSDLFATSRLPIVPGFSLELLQREATLTASLARKMAAGSPLSDAAFTTGLLHDVGKILLLLADPTAFARSLEQVAETACVSLEAETACFGVDHAQIGAYLIGLWGIPLSIVEAVAMHHLPVDPPDAPLSLASLVHVADVLIAEAMAAPNGASKLDERLAERPSLVSELPRLRELAAEMVGAS